MIRGMPEIKSNAAHEPRHEEADKRIGDCIRRRGSVLDLSGLCLTALPPRIRQLTQLTELDLSHNRFTSLPPEVLGFPNLSRLDLSHNPISSLSADITSCTKLTRLDLCHTEITSLPAGMGQLSSLTRLYLTHNRLDSLPSGLGSLSQLTRLYLSGNNLESLPCEFGQLAKLTRLDVSHNRLTTLPQELYQAGNLSVLDLSHNPLRSLSAALGQLRKLSVLHLSNAELETLPDEIGDLSGLTELDLARNRLATLPESLRQLEKLERLFLHDNPPLQLPPSILGPASSQSGDRRHATPKSVLDFHFGRLTGKTRPLHEARIILLGNSGAGKSTILQALRDQPFREREPVTTVPAIHDCIIDGGDGQPVTVHLWDFPGDMATHVLHPLFFNPGNLYVVVLTGKAGNRHAGAEYWLDMITSHAIASQSEVPPVVVALNQWHTPGCRAEIDRVALRQRYPCIRGFVEMDCRAKKGVPALKAALSRELDRMPWVWQPFPEEWDAVRKSIQAPEMLTESAYRTRCAEHGVHDQGQQDHLLEILHQLGNRLWVRHSQSDDDAKLTSVPWLLRHAYPLLVLARGHDGLIHGRDLEIILPGKNQEAARSELMRVFETLGLAHAGISSGVSFWLLPCAQPETAPTGVEEPGEAVSLTYIYQKYPAGLIPHLIVRRFDFIMESRERRLQWREGLVLSRKGARALVRVNPLLRELSITVTGPTKSRHQLADLCQAEMSELHTTLPDLIPVSESDSRGQTPSPAKTPVISSDSAR